MFSLLSSGSVLEELGRFEIFTNSYLKLLFKVGQQIFFKFNFYSPHFHQGIFHFQLGRGEPMLHTRLRPHCKEFLEKIAKLYELHVFTFGSRLYAHTIAGKWGIILIDFCKTFPTLLAIFLQVHLFFKFHPQIWRFAWLVFQVWAWGTDFLHCLFVSIRGKCLLTFCVPTIWVCWHTDWHLMFHMQAAAGLHYKYVCFYQWMFCFHISPVLLPNIQIYETITLFAVLFLAVFGCCLIRPKIMIFQLMTWGWLILQFI